MNNVIMRVRNFFATYFISPPPFFQIWDPTGTQAAVSKYSLDMSIT